MCGFGPGRGQVFRGHPEERDDDERQQGDKRERNDKRKAFVFGGDPRCEGHVGQVVGDLTAGGDALWSS